jgi:hypothetical protein
MPGSYIDVRNVKDAVNLRVIYTHDFEVRFFIAVLALKKYWNTKSELSIWH